MDYREKQQLLRDKLLNEKKYKEILDKAQQQPTDLKANLGINKTYEGPTPNAEYFQEAVKKVHGPEIPPNTLTKVAKLNPAVEELAPLAQTAEKAVEKSGMLSKLGKLAKYLGLAGVASGVVGIGNKAMAGDLAGAGLDAADLGSNILLEPTNPIGIIKQALQSEGLGRGSADTTGLEPFVQPGVSNSPRSTRASVKELKSITDPIGQEYRSAKKLKDKLGK